MADAKAEAKGGGGSKGGDEKGGGDAKGGYAPAEAKGSGGSRRLDAVCSDSDMDNASNRYGDVKALKADDWCIVKRSDGNWKYAQVDSWDGILIEVVVDDDGNCKMFQVDEDNMEDCEVKALGGGGGGAK